jgi:PPE-repeat protein
LPPYADALGRLKTRRQRPGHPAYTPPSYGTALQTVSRKAAVTDFLVAPPEVNSLRLHSGAGAGSMLAAATAWDGLAAELPSAASSFASVTSNLSGWWRGASSASMRGLAAAYVSWLHLAAIHAKQAAAQATAVAAAFDAAFAATVHPAVVAANRARLRSLAGANVFGQNASAIAAVEAEYEQMWAQDVAAMVGYHAEASVAVGQLMPWQQVAAGSPSGIVIAVPGAAPGRLTGAETSWQYAALNGMIGKNWLPGITPRVVNYPAAAGLISGLFKPTANESFAIGQRALNTAILDAVSSGQSVVVTGLSEGAIVIDREEAYLAHAPNAPSPSMLTFVEFANPERGLAETFLRVGMHIGGVGYTLGAAPVSQYNTTVVYTQYDGWADFPDRPWHLLADVNALAGVPYLHTPTAFASPADAVEVSSVTNALGGTTTTYMIPTTTLPLLMPLEQLGVPAPIINGLNNFLTPIVNQGYSQYDPNGGPYLSRGVLW